jgi:hypothetical protein
LASSVAFHLPPFALLPDTSVLHRDLVHASYLSLACQSHSLPAETLLNLTALSNTVCIVSLFVPSAQASLSAAWQTMLLVAVMMRQLSSKSSTRKWYITVLLRVFQPLRLTLHQLEDGDNYEAWEKLVRAVESVDGGINRNSSSQAITAMRDIYDRFLAKFPLFFGYWKKYADLEFSIAGTEAAEMVHRALQSGRDLPTDQR